MRVRVSKSVAIITGVAMAAAFGGRVEGQAHPSAPPLRQFDAAIQALVAKVSPSVVQILVAGLAQVAPGSQDSL